jgi:spore germination protein KC
MHSLCLQWSKDMDVKMKRKILLGLLLILVTSCCNGCWDRKELKTLAIIAGLGVDRGPDGKLRGTIQYINPSMIKTGGAQSSGGGDEATAAIWVTQGIAPTQFGADRQTRFQTSRSMYLSQMQILIFGKEVVTREGIRAVFDIHARYPQERLTAMVLIAKETANAALKAQNPLEKIPALALVNQINSSAKMTGQVLPVRHIDLFKMLISKTRAPTVPQVEVVQSAGVKTLRLAGTVVFKKDRWTGELTDTETRGLMWVLGRVQRALLEITGPTGRGRGALEILSATGKIRPRLRNGAVTMEIRVVAQANLVEVMVPENWSTPEKMQRLGAIGSTMIRREILSAWKVARRLDADIYGFGEAVGRKYPREWKRMEPHWDQIFPQIKLAIKVETNVVKTSELVKPLLPQ